MSGDPAAHARTLLHRFAAATGLSSDAAPRRYLWTDAFAVCTWLGLGEVDRAVALAETVHHTLGRHRSDDPREGWISGLGEAEGAAHPTAGGLRIGKPMPERGPDEPYDPQLEWERDGQYFHYLTRWMRALSRLSAVTGEERWGTWAAELGRVAYDRFSHGIGPVPNRLHWKMSIDLSRPLVPSMGQHDPLDGYVVLSEIRERTGDRTLDAARDGLAGMGEGSDWVTEDPLGTGSLLADIWFLARLDAGPGERDRLLERVLDAGSRSLREVREARVLELPASQRLPFREIGLALGLSALERLDDGALPDSIRLPDGPGPFLAEMREALPMRGEIVAFWSDEANQRAAPWIEHEDINTVMLAASLAPDGYLGID